jgi:hypothetical protein
MIDEILQLISATASALEALESLPEVPSDAPLGS